MRRAPCRLALFLLLANCGLVLAGPDPAAVDDGFEMVLSAGDNGTRCFWELGYGQARQKALEYLKAGEKEKAVEAAKMQFILCPLDQESLSASIKSVQQMLTAMDGDDVRAKRFEAYARKGPCGDDGIAGTADDLADPLKDVGIPDFVRTKEYLDRMDRILDERAAVSATWERGWYATEKALVHADGGDFDGAAGIAVAALVDYIDQPHARSDGSFEHQRIQDIIDRSQAALGVVFRARTGTTAGLGEFVKACTDYARYGPAGEDGSLGTPDDLEPPL